MTIRDVKKLLQKTWNTFFIRWGKLQAIQEDAIPLILEGNNAIIIAPASSGKTEAVFAPLIERYFKEKWKACSILYIAPTRALVNDMYYRIKDQLEELGIICVIKTGERSNLKSKKLPEVIITTPEAFDSLLCRCWKLFRNIKAIILDEIHLLDNTYRGDQLRVLIKRLKKIALGPFNTYCLSATISNPLDLGKRYMDDFKIIQDDHKKELEFTIVSSLEELKSFITENNLKKIIIFCNKRTKVEELSAKASNIFGRHKVTVHHGSLSKQEREETELTIKESREVLCFATMTLEIGIDIGDIDAIVLAEPPWSLSSLMQRIGRGNRRSNKNILIAICNSHEEKLIFEKMISSIRQGEIEPINYVPDISVIIQQIFSMLYANRYGLDSEYFYEVLNCLASKDVIDQILNHLLKNKYIEMVNNKWLACSKIIDRGEKGFIHSNIPDEKCLEVIDMKNGDLVGEIVFPVDEIFLLGGKCWQIIKVQSDKIYVRGIKIKENATVKFKRRCSNGAYFYYLPKHLRLSEEFEK